MKDKMNEKYNPKDFEDEIYKEWEENKYFKPSMDKTKESFCVMMPPPNVTGKLHMGHALDGTIQDILIRFKRMQGYNTLWLPGTDHASISTEMKVVQKLKEEGKTKQNIGREKFLEEAWNWTHIYGEKIEEQQKKLGCSCDWDRKRFTLDEGLSDAVLEEFVNLYNDGYIYKGKRMINWCPNCNTAISNAEVEYKEEQGNLWNIKYKIKNEENYIEIATTRPETMLGDTAVAVNPKDERYKNIIGKTCIVPIVNREIPIIADDFVDKEFGTGCVKITPAHDMNDYQAGKRNNLETIEVFDKNFKMGDLIQEYKGMDLISARKQIAKKLEELGALVQTKEHIHNVGKCERCKNTIEPKISKQWFVKMKELAKPAIEAVNNKEIKFVPEKYEKTYFNWLENIEDWCISRQLWWGHRIPAYYCDNCGDINVSKNMPAKCKKCENTKLVQDPDTLDTWFSSALWPFSTLGWPNKNAEDLKTFFPTNALVTGYDIIFFWVIRMVFSSYYALDKKPFKDVIIHGMVRDSQGRKMSKTLGNGIDPIEIIDKYGTDALRFSVISGTTMGNDIRYMTEKLDQASNFANKIWNAAKFIKLNMVSDEKIIEFKNKNYDKKTNTYKEGALKLSDKWIINKLDKIVIEITKNIENYDLGIAIDKIYNFIWNEFCDWYIEIVKVRLYGDIEDEKIQACYVLDQVFRTSLKLLHPFMPFITTKIYRNLVEYDNKDLIISNWPKLKEQFQFNMQEETIEKLKEILVGIRNIRSKMNIHPTKKTKLIVVTTKYEKELKEAEGVLLKLGFGNKAIIQKDKTNVPEDAISVITDGIELYIPLEGLIDFEEEKKRLLEEKKKLEGEVQRATKMLSNPGFVNKAPESKINEEKVKLIKYKEMLEQVEERLKNI